MSKLISVVRSRNRNILLGKNHVKSVLINNPILLANFETQPYDVHNLDGTPQSTAELTKEEALQFFTKMTEIRKMETAIGNLYKEKAVRGFCHLYSGQEAVAVGIKSVMRPEDTLITSYRCHAWTLLMDGSFQEVISELLGKMSGCSRGKGGSMHMYVRNFFGGNGIVGAHVPLGTGLGLAHKYKNDGGVSVTLFGDGASNQGQVFEAFNMAKLLSLPVLYAIENNIYAMGTSVSRGSAQTEMYKKGDYIPGIRLDGMDVLAVREGAKFCFDYIKSGKGPILLELVTYRYTGHSMSDPGTSYRTREEVNKVRETRDPIKLLREKIVSADLVTEDELKVIDNKIKQDVDNVVKKAKEDKEIAVEEVACDVYVASKEKIRMPQLHKYMEHKNVGHKPRNI